jgi:hypothetical protein
MYEKSGANGETFKIYRVPRKRKPLTGIRFCRELTHKPGFITKSLFLPFPFQ